LPRSVEGTRIDDILLVMTMDPSEPSGTASEGLPKNLQVGSGGAISRSVMFRFGATQSTCMMHRATPSFIAKIEQRSGVASNMPKNLSIATPIHFDGKTKSSE
jgi:hypothetical protein